MEMGVDDTRQLRHLIVEIDILKQVLDSRQRDSTNVMQALNKVIDSKSELQNTLILKDLVIDGQGGVTDKTKADEMF